MRYVIASLKTQGGFWSSSLGTVEGLQEASTFLTREEAMNAQPDNNWSVVLVDSILKSPETTLTEDDLEDLPDCSGFSEEHRILFEQTGGHYCMSCGKQDEFEILSARREENEIEIVLSCSNCRSITKERYKK